jgi:histone-lysine N-methyltransferase SETMAR
MDFLKSDIRKLIYYCWKRNLKTPDIAKEINATLGNDSVNVRTCQRWVARFVAGDFDTNDDQRCGRESYDLDDEIQEILTEDPYATTRTIAFMLEVSHESVWKHLKALGKKCLANKWLPHKLTQRNMINRERICNELLVMNRNNNFLAQLITLDEVWIYWDNDGTYHNRSWRGPGDQPLAVAKRRLTNRKHMASVFWDSKGVIMLDILPRGQTITAEYYCQQIDKLVIAIRQKRRRLTQGPLLQNVYYHHDNARPHTAFITVDKLNDLGFHVIPHPPYSPDLAPSDFYLFSAMKSAIRGRNYNNSLDIQRDIEKWIDSKPAKFFADGINKLPGRWARCVDHNGNYFEHLNDIDD